MKWFYSFFLLSMVSFQASSANDFPTLDRVDHVLTCMKKHGGQTLDNLYSCVCVVDAIATTMSYDEWVEASIYRSYRRMPGEKGGIFRETELGEDSTAELEKAETAAERRCFVGGKRASKAP